MPSHAMTTGRIAAVFALAGTAIGLATVPLLNAADAFHQEALPFLGIILRAVLVTLALLGIVLAVTAGVYASRGHPTRAGAATMGAAGGAAGQIALLVGFVLAFNIGFGLQMLYGAQTAHGLQESDAWSPPLGMAQISAMALGALPAALVGAGSAAILWTPHVQGSHRPSDVEHDAPGPIP